MDNNDILIRLRYALDLRDKEMVDIFEKGDARVTLEEVIKLLNKTENSYNYDPDAKEEVTSLTCSNGLLESFLNGLIVKKRGPHKSKTGQVIKPQLSLKEGLNPNNVLLKKLKIALTLTSEDMLNVFDKAGVKVTKSELSAFFRKEDHKHYRVCMDKYARSFLKGLTILYRK